MPTLERALANTVIDVLRAREHVVVAPCGDDALKSEVEAIIAPAVEDMAPSLRGGLRKVTRSLEGGDAQEVMASLVMQITEQLMESDHVDDIYATDRVIRRDAHKVIVEMLLAYANGEIDVEQASRQKSAFFVRLDALGYVAAKVSRRLDEASLAEVLRRAAAAVGASLIELDAARGVARFDSAGGPEAGRLPLEEAIIDELVALVEAKRVALPSIEQMLEVDSGLGALQGFDRALGRAAARTQGTTGCAAGCVALDDQRLIAVLTPLTEEAAADVHAHFDFFLSALEHELSKLETPPPRSAKQTRGARPSRTRARSASKRRA